MGACNSAKIKDSKNPNKKEEEKKEEEKKSEEKKEEEKKENETLNINKNEEEKKIEENKEEEKKIELNINTNKKNNFFTTNSSILQTQNLKYFQTKHSKENGEHIIMGFCDSFDILDDFFNLLYYEHNLNTNNPIYDYNKFFYFNNETNTYNPRALAINVPRSQYENIYMKSNIIDL